MKLSDQEKRDLEQLGMKLRLGLVPSFRLQSFTERLRGRDAAMGYSPSGRIADYAPLMSFILDEPVYRNKEVSPQCNVVLAICFTGEREFDDRISAYAAAWAYLVVEGLGANVAIVAFGTDKFEFAEPVFSFSGAAKAINSAKDQPCVVQSDDWFDSDKMRVRSQHFAGCVGAYFDGFHLVMISPYWEENVIRVCRSTAGYGVTFAMIEPESFDGARYFGDTMPRFLVRRRIQERRGALQHACRQVRANCLVCSSREKPVDALTRSLQSGRIF